MYYHYQPNNGVIWFNENKTDTIKFESPETAKALGRMIAKELITQYELDGSEMTIRYNYDNITSYIFTNMVYDIGSMVIIDDETDLKYGCPIPQKYLLDIAWVSQT